jgi:hypothetical protein
MQLLWIMAALVNYAGIFSGTLANFEVFKIQSFPGQVSVINFSDDFKFCVAFRQRAIWEEGDFWYRVEKIPILLFVDDNLVDTPLITSDGSLTQRMNNGKIIGAYGGMVEYCHLDALPEGRHTLSVLYLSRSGTLYTNMWNFTVQR